MYRVDGSSQALPEPDGEAPRDSAHGISGVPAPPCDPLEAEVVRLYNEHAPALLRYASVFASSSETAQDAVQEAFLRYVMFRSGGNDVHSPKAWLVRVMRNYLLNVVRHSRTHSHVGIEEAHGQAGRTGEDAAGGELSELAGLLSTLLSPRELECVRLRGEGFSYAEIGEILDIRSGTVGALLARVHSKLRKALSADEKGRRRRVQEQPKEVPYAP